MKKQAMPSRQAGRNMQNRFAPNRARQASNPIEPLIQRLENLDFYQFNWNPKQCKPFNQKLVPMRHPDDWCGLINEMLEQQLCPNEHIMTNLIKKLRQVEDIKRVYAVAIKNNVADSYVF